jgi:DNA adenine methylase
MSPPVADTERDDFEHRRLDASSRRTARRTTTVSLPPPIILPYESMSPPVADSEADDFEQVPALKARPLAPYVGGKRQLAPRLVRIFEQIPHKMYVEVFLGMGGPFFKRSLRPKKEVINDVSHEVTNLYRMVKCHLSGLIEELNWQLASRADFDHLKDINPSHLTEIQRAARFFYLQRLGFGGIGTHFGVNQDRASQYNRDNFIPIMENVRDRLSSVTIECLQFADCINRYDRPETLFYCDPPYWGHEDQYGKDIFCREDFQRLMDQLSNIQGRFVLSINDKPEIREIFKGFKIEEVKLHYHVGGQAMPAKELVISN